MSPSVELAQMIVALAKPVFVTPAFSLQAMIELVVPLAITVLVVQNAQGFAILQAAGHKPPANAVTMACGVGGCAGCVVEVRTPEGPAMKRVCVDGPVFDANAVYPPAA